MALIEHDFIGAMDLDSPLQKVMPGFVIGARNVIWRGFPNKRRAESVPGTNARFNPLLPAGVNKCIGCWYDSVNQQIFDFNYNSNGNHGIYIYSTVGNTWQRLIEVGVGTDGDILGFTASGRITSIAIIYGDNNSGNLLVFIDSLGRPTKINIRRYLLNTYNPIKRSFIDLMKAPPRMPPRVTYENDGNCTINNMRNALFQFRYRFVYDDNDKSVYSTCSIVALPNIPFNQVIDSDPTQNCRQSIHVSTGDADVVKIEIWVRQVTDSGASEWLLVTSLDKTQLNINSNDIYRYLFYNDGSYTPGDTKEIDLLFDFVPRGTNSLVLLNGSVIMFGGITEGYNPVPINATLATNNNYTPPRTTVNGVLFFASQGGVDSYGSGSILNVYLTGTGVNDGSGNPTTIPLVKGAHAFVVDCATASGTSLKFQYDNFSGFTTITDILNNLKTAALAQGFTFVSQTQNVLTLTYPSPFNLYYGQVNSEVIGFALTEASLAYGHKDANQFAIEYFDAKGRTNGALLPVSSSIQTLEDLSGTTIPQILLTVYNRPPSWAYYWQLVRSLNLTYNKRLFWVSNSTFQQVDPGTGIKYAYINIANMAGYNQSIQASTPVVSYDFTAGDRIQFLQLFHFGSPSGIDLTLKNDYEILSVVNNPIANGVTQTGRFIRIQYPTADINSNFDFGGTFQNYKILLYNYVKHATTQANVVMFEFGRAFGIGNPGTSNAYHIGSDQTQAADLSTPAIVSTVEGDMFWRDRTVPAGNSIPIVTSSYIQAGTYSTFTVNVGTPVTNSIYSTRGGVHTGAGLTNAEYPTNANNDYIVRNESAVDLSVRLRLTYTVTPNNPSDHNGMHWFGVKLVNNSNVVRNIQLLPTQTGLEANNTYTYTIDSYITLHTTEKLWNISFCQNQMVIGDGSGSIDILNDITIPIIESSYSDKYNIVTNSNGRSTVYDPNAGEFYYNTLVRWGQQYQLGTNLNNSNRFYAQDFDEFDKQYGDIMRMIPRNREVDIFQKRKCGHVGVYGRFVQNNQGQQELLTTDAIITANNIQYYSGDYGVGDQFDCIATSGFQRWFLDPVKGVIVRLSLNGCEPISDLCKVQTWAGVNLPNYLNSYTYPFGGTSVMLATHHVTKDRDAEVLFCFQEGSLGPNSIPPQTLAYEETGTRFTAFHDFAPDAILNAENMLYSFKNGVLYSHDNNTTVANFYGTQQTPQIICIFNDMILEKKSWISLFQLADRQWNAPLIYTDTYTYGTQRQESKLVDANFAYLEGRWESAFFRDIKSQKGWINGDYLKGVLLVAELQVSNPQNFTYLSNVGIKFNPSQLTQK